MAGKFLTKDQKLNKNMEFESPDVMKDFPGLYASENSKKGSNDSDYSDEPDKLAKKDLLNKRKEKKDKKDKERGYAALEGESSADEIDSRSPSKIKKSKTFKFVTTKSKEKREKSREKDVIDKKAKDKEKKSDKKVEKDKKADKKERKCKSADEHADIADGMPVFGVPLDIAVERSRCHDGIDLPLPVRACIDYIQSDGLSMEGVYKISGTKSKVIQIRKLYNQREHVDLTEYDIPIATSLLKLFLRDLPEPIFTSDLLVRFEEAGAILNVGTREKHLKILVENLPANNRLLLSWIVIHFDDIVLNERLNKMNITHMVGALAPTLHTSNRLLTALILHCRALFPTVILELYKPPLSSSAKMPDDLENLENELKKQESLLSQIHAEMNAGFITKTREELLWEVQRTITQLKRKIKNLQKEEEKKEEPKILSAQTSTSVVTVITATVSASTPAVKEITPETPLPLPIPVQEKFEEELVFPQLQMPETESESSPPSSNTTTDTCIGMAVVDSPERPPSPLPHTHALVYEPQTEHEYLHEPEFDEHEQITQLELHRKTIDKALLPHTDEAIALLQNKHAALSDLRDKLSLCIQEERAEIVLLKRQLLPEEPVIVCVSNDNKMDLDKVMKVLQKENQILEIEKINLVRRIMEQEEMCIDLKSKLMLISN